MEFDIRVIEDIKSVLGYTPTRLRRIKKEVEPELFDVIMKNRGIRLEVLTEAHIAHISLIETLRVFPQLLGMWNVTTPEIRDGVIADSNGRFMRLRCKDKFFVHIMYGLDDFGVDYDHATSSATGAAIPTR